MSLLTLEKAEIQVAFLKIYRYGKNLKVFNRARKMPFQGSGAPNAVLRRLVRDFAKGALKKYVDKVQLKRWDDFLQFNFNDEINQQLGYIFGNLMCLDEKEAAEIEEVRNAFFRGENVSCRFDRSGIVGTCNVGLMSEYYTCVQRIISFKEFLEKELDPLLQRFDSLKEKIEEKKEVLRQERREKALRLRERQEALRAAEKLRREELHKNQEEQREKIKVALQAALEKRKEQMKEDKERQEKLELIKKEKQENEKEEQENAKEEQENKKKELEQLKEIMVKSAEKNQTEAQTRFNASLQKYLERQS